MKKTRWGRFFPPLLSTLGSVFPFPFFFFLLPKGERIKVMVHWRSVLGCVLATFGARSLSKMEKGKNPC